MSQRISVPGTGPRDARIVLVGEQPGKTEILQGRPFVGPAGRELDDCLRQAGLIRSEIYLTNVIKNLDRPLTHFLSKPQRAPPTWTEDGRFMVDILRQELCDLQPNVVVPIGNCALFAMTERWGITKWRGSIVESTLLPGKKCIPCLHPATVIPPKNVFTNKLLIAHDLFKAAREQHFPEIKLSARIITIRPSFDEAMQYLHQCIEWGHRLNIVDFDIEVVNEQVSCIAFAMGPHTAMCIPFTGPGGDYFTPDQELAIWRVITKLLGDPAIAKRGQNVSFDCHFLLRVLGIRVKGPIHDTMVAQKISMPDYPAGLDFITSVHTDIPYYKDEGKKWFKLGGPWEQFWRYNGTDAIATAAAFPKQQEDLRRQDNLTTYERQRSVIPPILYMMERGIKVDVAGMESERQRASARVEELQDKLNGLAGYVLNPNSPKQLAEYFYGKRGLKAYRKRRSDGTSSVTTDDDAMKRIARQGFEEASIIQELRYLTTKVLGTYLDTSKVSPDGRYRSAYNPVGTRTGRLSSSENIFGEGGNQQNWPHELLRYLCADDGYLYCSYDLSQAENRIVAYVGRVTEMIEAFEAGIDIHSLTASLIFGFPVEQILDWDKSNTTFSELGDGKHSHRFWGKKANHGLNYDLGYRKFSLLYEMPETQGKWIVDRYHAAYPGVRSSYHQLVKSMLSGNRTVTNLMGRNRVFLGQWGDELFKEAYAQIPQSSVADKINEHGVIPLYYDNKYAPVELLNQIHDSVGFQIPLRLGWAHIAMILQEVKQILEHPFRWHDREFVIPADLTIGLNLYKGEGIEFKAKKWPATISDLASRLEAAHAQLVQNLNKKEDKG